MARTTAAGQANLSIPDPIPVTLIVNGAEHNLSVVPWITLLDALREHLELTGTKKFTYVLAVTRVGVGRGADRGGA